MLILLTLFGWIIADQRGNTNSLQNNSEISRTDKTTDTKDTRLYQDITAPQNDLKGFALEVAIEYGLDWEKFNYTIQNESSYNPLSDNGISVGVAQFTLPTWFDYCGKIDDRTNPIKSIKCMGKMWSLGLQFKWDAYCFHYYDEKCIKLRNLYPK